MAGTNELDDLLTAVGASGDRDAFARLFDHFGPRVHSYLVRLGLDPAAAAEATQDVMETIWRKAHLFDSRKAGAATWVFRVARNRRIDLGRRNREDPHVAEDFLAIPDEATAATIGFDSARREERLRDRDGDLAAGADANWCGSPSSTACRTAPSRSARNCRSAP